MSAAEVARWAYETATARPCDVHAVVLRGYDYGSSRAASYGHDGWMSDFRAFCSRVSRTRPIKFVEITDAPRLLNSGAVLVDKTTARITYIVLSPTSHPPMFRMVNSSLAIKYSEAQEMQDLFVGSLLYGHRGLCDAPDLGLQYDVDRYLGPLHLTDEARALVRSRSAGEPLAAQSNILKSFALSDDWISQRSEFLLMNRIFDDLLAVGPPCERCGERGTKKCGACKGAWYCSDVHQKEDWKSHKSWCKAHAGNK